MKDYSKTLFVCTGNIFRSILAEKLFVQQAMRLNLPFQVRSCGTDPYFETPNPLLIDIVLQRHSIDIRECRAQKISIDDIHWASIVICFTSEHREAVLKLIPTAKDKTFLIQDIAFMDPPLFEDIDYHDVSETNEKLLQSLNALARAVNRLLKPQTLSVVIAVHNEEKTIGNILKKLLFQSSRHKLKEIIVVSSGSTDRTNAIIESFESPSVVLVREAQRNGKVSALKKSIPFITGENVLLLDGDVDIDNNFLKACLRCIYENRFPCTGKIVPIKINDGLFYKLSVAGCEAWNNLRAKNDEANEFLYPSGYVMILSKNDFINTTEYMSSETINDDGLLAFLLFQKGVIFRYCDEIQVYVVFPYSFRDFFRQKIRTRMGRRQIYTNFFNQVERQWRRELISLVNRHNFFFIALFLLLDFISRYIAGVKINVSRYPHLWSPVPSTKQIPLP